MTTVPFEIETGAGTTSSGVGPMRSPSQTMASITRGFGMLRDETSLLDADVGSDHRAALMYTLELLARDLSREDVPALLAKLVSDFGLGWSDIARLVGVSVQALRKWRHGEPATGENRLSVARLAAFLELLRDIPVQEPASWLEMPVVVGHSPRHFDLYREGHVGVLFDLAHLRIGPERALDETEPRWREAHRLAYETYEAADGQRSIRKRR